MKDKAYKKIYLINFLISFLYLISYNTLNIHLFIISFILNIYLFYVLKFNLKTPLLFTLISLMILSIPYSFNNIFFTSYGELPLSWYNIYFILLFMSTFYKLKFAKNRFYIACLLFLWLIISVLNSYDLFGGVKDLINFLPLLFLFSLQVKQIKTKEYINIYINTAIVSSLILFVQVIFSYFSIFLGKLDLYPNRIAFGATFSDFSFLSLFLISGACMSFVEKKYLSTAILIIASFLTSARTGLVAFMVAVVFFSLLEFKKRRSFAELFRLTVLMSFLLIVFFYFFPLIRQENLLGGSGRLLSYKLGIEKFIEYPLLGVGLGVESFKRIYGFTIPHNILFQLGLQSGFISVILYAMINIKALYISYKKNKVFLALLTVVIGSMLIPDIMNSRFFPLLVFIGINSIDTKKEAVLSK